MKLQGFRLGLAGLLVWAGITLLVTAALAQDQATLANTANQGMGAMLQHLGAALNATSESAARAEVNAAISAGETAVEALRELNSIATDDVVRSRSKAALDQTQSAINKARAALAASGDAFSSGIKAAFDEVEEAIEEFAPVLPLVGEARTTTSPVELPRSGEIALSKSGLALLSIAGASLAGAGFLLRRRLKFSV